MELTADDAALMAQVIPTLLIIVALEPQLRAKEVKDKIKSPAGRWFATKGREFATIGGITAVAMCIFVVLTDGPLLVATIWVGLATLWLVVVMTALLAMMFGHEQGGTGEP
ncbi:hypothetical protein ACX80U_05805 [Arthrobacter sp. TmT3-37]